MSDTKPRVRVQATADSFTNFQSRVGMGADNLLSTSHYSPAFTSRNRQNLEWMYRGSWMVGAMVDCPAEDMTREWIEYQGTLAPDVIDRLVSANRRMLIKDRVQDTIKWARLYGGALGFLMIDGQDPATPLRPDTVGLNQFKGILVLDRWMVQPSMERLITELGPMLGYPEFYRTIVESQGIPNMSIHHSRVIRLDGVTLPWNQRASENWWGQSVLERPYDRMVAFDSTTMGTAQLVHKAHLRTYKVPQLRELIATGGKAFEALLQQINMIRAFQTNEGMTLMDGEDEFEAHQYSFSGLSDVLMQFGQQLAGATGIPLVRLFGMSPTGMNSTGESDIRNYYDKISSDQERMLLAPITLVQRLVYASEFGTPPPDDFGIRFRPLWQMSDEERAGIANQTTNTVVAAFEAGLVGRDTALKEMRQSADHTGIWSNITDEDVLIAAADPPPGSEAMGNPDTAGPEDAQDGQETGPDGLPVDASDVGTDAPPPPPGA